MLSDLAGGASVTTVKVTLTSANILALNPASLFQLIPPQGAGKFINVIKTSFVYNFNSTQYTNTGGTGLTVLVGTSLLGGIPIASGTGLLTGFNTAMQRPPISNTSIIGTQYSNVGVQLYSVGTYAGGDGTLDVLITYDVVTL
jgi:hypothetical protein